jgi:hypothetical protein
MPVSTSKMMEPEGPLGAHDPVVHLLVHGIPISRENIHLLTVKRGLFDVFPVMTCTMQMSEEQVEHFPIYEGTLVGLSMDSKQEGERPNQDPGLWVVQNFRYDGSANANHAPVMFTAVPPKMVEMMLDLDSRAYENSSSVAVIADIATRLGMRVDVRCDDTDDKMNWIKCEESEFTFLKRVIQHSWTGPNNTMICWADELGNFVITTLKDIQKEFTDRPRVFVQADEAFGKNRDPIEGWEVYNFTDFDQMSDGALNNLTKIGGFGTIMFRYSYNGTKFEERNIGISDAFPGLLMFPKYGLNRATNKHLVFHNSRNQHKHYQEAFLVNEAIKNYIQNRDTAITMNKYNKLELGDPALLSSLRKIQDRSNIDLTETAYGGPVILTGITDVYENGEVTQTLLCGNVGLPTKHDIAEEIIEQYVNTNSDNVAKS